MAGHQSIFINEQTCNKQTELLQSCTRGRERNCGVKERRGKEGRETRRNNYVNNILRFLLSEALSTCVPSPNGPPGSVLQTQSTGD